MTLSDISIKNPVFAWMLMAALIIFGMVSYGRLGVGQLGSLGDHVAAAVDDRAVRRVAPRIKDIDHRSLRGRRDLLERQPPLHGHPSVAPPDAPEVRAHVLVAVVGAVRAHVALVEARAELGHPVTQGIHRGRRILPRLPAAPGVDRDHVTAQVERRAAGIARIDRRVQQHLVPAPGHRPARVLADGRAGGRPRLVHPVDQEEEPRGERRA